nr:f-box protein [Quercus suber]
MVLNSFNFDICEWSKVYVIQYAPKDQATGVSGDNGDSKLAIRKVAFMSLSPGFDRYRTIVTVNPTTSKVSSVGIYGMVIAADKVRLINFYDALVLVAIHYNLSDADLRSEIHIVCSKPNGVLVGFKIFVQDKERLKWVSVKNLKEVILFLGTSCTFWNVASDFPGCKGNSIIFSEPRWEAIFVTDQYTR